MVGTHLGANGRKMLYVYCVEEEQIGNLCILGRGGVGRVESGVVQTTDGARKTGDEKNWPRRWQQTVLAVEPYPANPHSWDPEDVNGGWVRTCLAFVREGQLEAASIPRQRRFCRFCGDGPAQAGAMQSLRGVRYDVWSFEIERRTRYAVDERFDFTSRPCQISLTGQTAAQQWSVPAKIS
jgi:hypothetical protein